MDIRDFIVAPIYIIFFFFLAYLLKPRLTNEDTAPYFYPALFVKFIGALALGLVYQFYYGGGDTFNYHTHGSRVIWEAFMDSPSTALNLIFSNGRHVPEYYRYSSQIYFFSDNNSFFVIRLAAFFDLLTFSSYAATGMFFAFFSFLGMWQCYQVFYRNYPHLNFWLAIGCLFVPSVIFWGSGVLKDSLILGCLGFLTYFLYQIFVNKSISITNIVYTVLFIFIIFSIKKFILQAFLPAAIIWVYLSNLNRIQSFVMRVLVLPIAIILSLIGAYYTAIKIGENDVRYSIENIAYTSRSTAKDIRFQSGAGAGSGYELSEYFDGSLGNTLRLAPEAINVTLFRPYLWEVKNPLMLMSALESFALLLFTLLIVIRKGYGAFTKLLNPEIAFCFSFSMVYGFAVGASTYNFGTLARYKIPILPFYFCGLVILYSLVRERKVEELEEIENSSTTV